LALNAGSPADRAESQRIAVKESRLGIPLLFRRVIHGYRISFDSSGPLRQLESGADSAGGSHVREAAGIRWTFAPMIDITRDPRWGRVAETLREDPYLTGTLGNSMIRGLQ
jgi:beta-glucosidase